MGQADLKCEPMTITLAIVVLLASIISIKKFFVAIKDGYYARCGFVVCM